PCIVFGDRMELRKVEGDQLDVGHGRLRSCVSGIMGRDNEDRQPRPPSAAAAQPRWNGSAGAVSMLNFFVFRDPFPCLWTRPRTSAPPLPLRPYRPWSRRRASESAKS